MESQVITQVDIAICTWNRDALLAQTLDSLLRLRIPDSISLTVLIVDNNSTDHTPSVIDSFTSTANWLSVVRLSESNQGHTYCRNKAIDNATGELMLWTDDDVIVAPDWVEKYAAAASLDQESVFWGSVIEPEFSEGRPEWISKNWDNLKGCFAHRDLGQRPLTFTTSRLPYGANFGVRTPIQKQFRYSTELGRRGNQVLGEDEIDLFRRMIVSGLRGTWIPGALVEHIIPPDRATEKYVYDYFVGQGRALVARNEAWHNDVAKFKSEAGLEWAKYKLKRAFAAPETWVSHMLRSALAHGQYDALS